MAGIIKNNKCKRVRDWLGEVIKRRIDINADWLQKHVKNCSRCQRRLVSYGKINLAISAIKSQPHKLDLLMRANIQTVNVLKHSLRKARKAEKLKTIRPEPKLVETYGKYSSSVLNVAACMAIMFLMKFGVLSSMNMFQNQGPKVIKKYYANRIGDDLADEIFPKKELPPLSNPH